MGFLRRDREQLKKGDSKLRRRLANLSRVDLLDLLEGHLGQLGVCVLHIRRGDENITDATWEAARLASEINVILDELDDRD